MNIRILAITHKKYWLPADDIYMPLQVGNKINQLGFRRDDSGDNIAAKNANFCELTGMYWAWKNLDCDYIGVCHYRRYFASKSCHYSVKRKKELILTRRDYEKLLTGFDVILPQKRHYYIETVYSQYAHAHNGKDLELAKEIMAEKYPDYMDAFNTVMSKRSLHLYNMFVMKKPLFDEYCSWLFDILFAMEERIDITSYSEYEARVFGFISERLFNVWLLKNNLNSVEVPVVFLENEHWGRKIYRFLRRKFKS